MIAVVSSLAGWLAAFMATATGQWIVVFVLIGAALLQGFFDLFTRLGVFLVERLFLIFIAVATELVAILPAAPDAPPADLQPMVDALALANRYLPITEAFSAVAMAGGIIASLWAYKAVKLIRGWG